MCPINTYILQVKIADMTAEQAHMTAEQAL